MLRLVVTAKGCGPIGGKDRDVHCEIGKLHHGRPGNRAAGPNVVFLKMASHADIRVIHALYCQPAARINPAERPRQQISDLFGRHQSRSFQFIHFSQDQPVTSPNFFKIPMPSHAIVEATRAGDAIFTKRFTSIVPLLDKRIPHA